MKKSKFIVLVLALLCLFSFNTILQGSINAQGFASVAAPNSTDSALIRWEVSQINLKSAWNIETGSSDVVVGVIDSGIDITHPALANRVDTTLSKDFSNETNDPFDDRLSHGTFVAGLIGAEAASASEMSGVCKDVTLVSLKVGNISFVNYSNQVAEAINYATQMRIPILNISMTMRNTAELAEAVANYDGLIICAAGNALLDIDNNNHKTYPASYENDNIICVGASNIYDKPAQFSSFGKSSVDIFAPGEDIYSTTVGSSYDKQSGTSFATPLVTGVAALLKSHDATLTPASIKETILNNCDFVAAFSDLCSTGGRLNAYNAILNSHQHVYTSYNYVSQYYHEETCACGYSRQAVHNYHGHDCVCGATKHDYQASYEWIDTKSHYSYCACGERIKSAHVVSSDSGNGIKPARCLTCGGLADFGSTVHPFRIILTPNGSYALPNGVIVLVQEDVTAYFEGTLTFSDHT